MDEILLQGFCGSRAQNAELYLSLNGNDVTSNGNDPTDDVIIYRDSEQISGKVGV